MPICQSKITMLTQRASFCRSRYLERFLSMSHKICKILLLILVAHYLKFQKDSIRNKPTTDQSILTHKHGPASRQYESLLVKPTVVFSKLQFISTAWNRHLHSLVFHKVLVHVFKIMLRWIQLWIGYSCTIECTRDHLLFPNNYHVQFKLKLR